jgi:ABC-2 type transport system ATP-binding protein
VPATRKLDPAVGVIAVDRLSKRFGTIQAVDDLSFTVQPGRVTGFLGPNGAGKTTTLRVLLGLARPDAGTATIGGRRYHDLPHPASVVGAALEAASFHPGRTARDHLRVYAPQVGVRDTRCDEVLEIVGLTSVANRRVGGFSMGMRQRLGLAATLLGDPQVLALDEPANGLDPEGIVWLRTFLRFLAGEGRTVVISSHVLSEVEQTVDDTVIISRGRLVHASPLSELSSKAEASVRVTSPDDAALRVMIDDHGWGPLTTYPTPREAVIAGGPDAAQVGAAAFVARVELHDLSTHRVSLEDIFLQLTRDAVADDPAGDGPPGMPGVAGTAARGGTR